MIHDGDIREYLLGRLDDAPELVEQIDEQILTDPQFSMIVDVVEDEIIEEYIEGSLSLGDLQSVERHFLRPPERQRKLRNARLLNRHLTAASRRGESLERLEPPRHIFPVWARLWRLPHFRSYAEIAAVAIFIVAIASQVYQHRELGIALERSNQQLTEERQKEIALNQPVQPEPQIDQQPANELHLFEPGLSRGSGHLPAVSVGAASGTLHIEVAITSDRTGESHRPASKYQVQLKRQGQTFWSTDNIKPRLVRGGEIFKIKIPERALPIGICELAVTRPGQTDLSYFFIVSDAR